MTPRAVVFLVLLLASSCTSSSSSGDVTDGTPRPLRPLGSPTPVAETPEASPESPDVDTPPTPLPSPGGAELQAASGVQRGRVNPYCWSAYRGAPSECAEGGDGTPRPLRVRSGEVVGLVIEAARAPDEASIRAFQGSRADYPSQRVDPALRTDLTLDLPAGGWELDLCAAWYGHGQPICWVFSLEVFTPQTPTPPPTPPPSPTPDP